MSTWTGCSQYYMIMMWTFSDLQDILWGPLHHSSHGRLLHLHRLPVQWHFLQITQFVWVLVVRPRRVSMLLCRAVQRHTCTHEHTVSLGVCAWLHYHCLAAVSVCCCIGLFRDAPVHMSTPYTWVSLPGYVISHWVHRLCRFWYYSLHK